MREIRNILAFSERFKKKNEKSGTKHKCGHTSALKIFTHKIHQYSPINLKKNPQVFNLQGRRALIDFLWHEIERMYPWISRDARMSIFFVRPSLCGGQNLPLHWLKIGPTPEAMDYGRPMKPFFIDIQNFWAWADKLGYLGYF